MRCLNRDGGGEGSGVALFLGSGGGFIAFAFERGAGFAGAFATLLRGATESAFTATAGRAACAGGTARAFAARHAAAAHHFAHFGHALGEFFTGELAVAVLVHATEGLFHEGGGAFGARAAFRAVAVRAGSAFGAAHAFALGAVAVGTRATFGAITAFGWATEAAVAFGTTHAFAFRAAHAFGAAATAGSTHAFGDLGGFGFVDVAVAIAVDAGEGFFHFGGAGFDEFVFADFAIAVGVGAFEHVGGVAAFGSAGAARGTWAVAVLAEAGGGEKGAEEEGGFDFHDVVVWRLGLGPLV